MAASISAVVGLVTALGGFVIGYLTMRDARRTALEQAQVAADAQLRLNLFERSGQAVEKALADLHVTQKFASEFLTEDVCAIARGVDPPDRDYKPDADVSIVFLPPELEEVYVEEKRQIHTQLNKLLDMVDAKAEETRQGGFVAAERIGGEIVARCEEATRIFENAAREWKQKNWAALMPIAQAAPGTEPAKSEKD